MNAILPTNAFGERLPTRGQLLKDTAVREFLTVTIQSLLAAAGTAPSKIAHVAEVLLSIGLFDGDKHEYPQLLFETILEYAPLAGRDRLLDERVGRLNRLFSQFLVKGSILDLGCGDGRIGISFSERGHKVYSADLKDSRAVQSGDFLSVQGEVDSGRPSESIDNVVLSSVLHHCAFPERSLDEATRVVRKGGRILIMDSTYGATGKDLPCDAAERDRAFVRLSEHQQFEAMCFLDVFCNYYAFSSRDKLMDYPIPCNFRKLEDWDNEIKRTSLRCIHFEKLGLDHTIAPLFHAFIVLEK